MALRLPAPAAPWLPTAGRAHVPWRAAWLLPLAALGLAVGLAPPLYTGVAVLGVIGLTAVIIRPEIGLYLLTLSVPYQNLRGADPTTVQLSATEPLVALTLAAFFLHQLVLQRGSWRRGPLIVPLVIFLASVVLSVFKATDQLQSLKELVKWLELLAVYWMAINTLKKPRQVATLLTFAVLAALSEAAIGALQVVLRKGPPEFLIGGFIMRAYGTFGQPNPLAGYLNLTLPIVLAVGLFASSRRLRWACWLSAAAIGLVMVTTLSRGAWLGFAVSLAVMGIAMNRRVRFWVWFGLLCAAFVLLAAVLGVIPFGLTARLLAAFGLSGVSLDNVTAQNFSAVQRLAFWQAGWNMFRGNIILGVGIGNYITAYPTYAAPGWSQVLGHAHDYYLNMAAECGLLGLSGYLVFLLSAFRHAAGTVRATLSRPWFGVAVGLLGSLTAISVHNLVDNMYVHGIPVLLGLLLGAVTVLWQWACSPADVAAAPAAAPN
ncbi:MAG: O-antigen ligase family protein [Chloroflexota bacterium]